ncbi:MAG: hypothetical protein LBL45_09105 [Treponema sp.]|nr:hypothetical protein [Treponema sp.]
MKTKNMFFLLLLTAALALTACPNSGGDDDSDDISWTSENNGTLAVINNTPNDMVLFRGQIPNASAILGGVRAGSAKTFDISDDVDDFDVGGYIILRGMSKDEYEANKTNFANTRTDCSAMATYGQGKKFCTEINLAYSGNYYFKVTNAGRIGMELRKDRPDGEKIGYLPALATNYPLYADSTDDLAIFPVYVFYSNTTKTVTTIRATSFAESVFVGPPPDNGSKRSNGTVPQR